MDALKTTSESGPKPNRRARRVAVILLVVCLIYTLSAGPFVALIVWAGTWNDPSVMTFGTVLYAPLLCLGRYTPLGVPLRLYVSWWAELGQWFRPLPDTVQHPRPEKPSAPYYFPTNP
jgi:hypothetical protein